MAITRHTSAYTAYTLMLLAMSTSVYSAEDVDLNKMTPMGCYSSPQPLTKNSEYTYQTSGWCQPLCVKANKAVLGLTNANECWCGDEVPPANAKVDDSKCNDPCDGFDQEMCGGNGYWTVFLTGIEDNVPHLGSSQSTATATVSTPSVVTSVSPNKTILKTVTPSAGSQSSGGGGSNPTAIAAGVVVAVVVISGILLGLFFWLRHRRRQATVEEYKRNQVADFVRGGEKKPPQTGYSSMSDSRLEPAFGDKRNSSGSIADNEDFSRKILRVANPDRS